MNGTASTRYCLALLTGRKDNPSKKKLNTQVAERRSTWQNIAERTPRDTTTIINRLMQKFGGFVPVSMHDSNQAAQELNVP